MKRCVIAVSPPLSAETLPPNPTLADAAAAVKGWNCLSEARRRDLLHALSGAAQLAGKPLTRVPFDVAWLNDHLFVRASEEVSIGSGRRRNILSGTRFVLRRFGLHAPDMRWDPQPLLASWEPVVSLASQVCVPAQIGCVRELGQYCTANGIEPSEVDDTVLQAWADDARRRRLGQQAATRAITLAKAWNALVATPNGKPLKLCRLRAKPRRQPYVLPITAYPMSFQEDYARFERQLSGGAGGRGIFTSSVTAGPSRPLRPATIKTRLFALLQSAAALVIKGLVRPDQLLSLRDLVETLERAGAILDYFDERCPRESGGQLAVIAETLRILATHYADVDEKVLRKIKEWADQTGNRRQAGMAPKVRERLRALIQQRPRALLLNLPEHLMHCARLPGQSRVEAARLARLAAIIEVLLICPMRVTNLRLLQPDEHFRRLDSQGRRLTHIVIAATNTKNREPIEWPVPLESAHLIEAYIRDFRPALADPQNPYLFPGEALAAYSQQGLTHQLVRVVRKEVGVTVHAHLFRHFAAWMHLQRYPGHYEDVRRILGHRDIATTMKAYVGFETEAAAERFDVAVLKERQAGRGLAKLVHSKRVRRHASKPATKDGPSAPRATP